MNTKILDLFKEIAIPFHRGMNARQVESELFSDITISKEEKIMELLKEYSPQYVENIGIIIPAETKYPSKVIVSHIDLVYPFQKGFADNKSFVVDKYKGEDYIIGALDNTITNAVLIMAIIELRSKGFAKNIEFLFTEGEESGLTGMRNYMKSEFPHKSNPFFINLDVTNDNWDYSGSIEFDRPNKRICADINNSLLKTNDPIFTGFTNIRFTDDTTAILSYGGNAFSFCIPTLEYCHSYESKTKLAYLIPYYKSLLFMIKDLNTDNYVYDIEILNNINVTKF